MVLEQNQLNKEPQESLDKNVLPVTQARKKGMACVTSSGQVAEMVKCSRPSQTESIFVATDAFAGKVYVEDLIAKRNMTAK